MELQSMTARVAPVPVMEFKVIEYADGDQWDTEELQKDLDAAGAEGWVINGIDHIRALIFMARQTALRMVPVEFPAVMGAADGPRLIR